MQKMITKIIMVKSWHDAYIDVLDCIKLIFVLESILHCATALVFFHYDKKSAEIKVITAIKLLSHGKFTCDMIYYDQTEQKCYFKYCSK